MSLFRSIRFCWLLLPLLAGCGKDSYPEEKRPDISFSPGVTVETKTGSAKPNDQSVLIADGKQISLFGQLVLNEGEQNESVTPIFNNRILACSGSQGNYSWSYSPLQYWEEEGHYYFAAVYPYHASNVSIGNEGNAFFINALYRAGENNDLMVARSHRDMDSSIDKSTVPLTFKHACSAVRFLFGKESTDPTADEFTLTDFSLSGLSVSGTLRVQAQMTSNPDVSSGNHDAAYWIPGSIGSLFSWTADTPAARKNIPHPSVAHDPDGYLQMGWYYMVPQTLANTAAVTFSISYSGQSPMTTEFVITDRDGTPGADTWEPNQVYNYYITITESGLNLSVVATPWDNVNVSTDDIVFMPS
ncbi:MAG: fimbrillin family protein [Bacteroidales bacterium]|nr:fimbrillin family protein [Bacteroidales bacterium]